MRISCPIVGTEVLSAISSRTLDLNTANEEITQADRDACDRSFDCSRQRCASVRSDFVRAIRIPMPPVPPPPFGAPAPRPSARPPPCLLAIPEDSPSQAPTAISITPPLNDPLWAAAVGAYVPWDSLPTLVRPIEGSSSSTMCPISYRTSRVAPRTKDVLPLARMVGFEPLRYSHPAHRSLPTLTQQPSISRP